VRIQVRRGAPAIEKDMVWVTDRSAECLCSDDGQNDIGPAFSARGMTNFSKIRVTHKRHATMGCARSLATAVAPTEPVVPIVCGGWCEGGHAGHMSNRVHAGARGRGEPIHDGGGTVLQNLPWYADGR
jgi:hypothetical protein